jgi:hypothetical protein
VFGKENLMSDMDDQIEFKIDDASKVEVSKTEPVIELVDEPVHDLEETEKPEKDVDKALKSLNKRLEKERKARIEAEALAREASEQARMAHNEVTDSNLHLVSGAIESVKRDQEILKSHLRDAMAIGDYDKAADLQEQMASNITNLRQLERGFEEMRQQPRMQPQAPQQRELSVDTLIEQVTPRSAEWLQRNREHLPDQRSIRVMARAHEDAVDFGIVPESDAYFQFVENRLGISNKRSSIPEVDDVMSDAASTKQRRSSPPAAPVSRQPIDAPHRPGVIRLTPAEVEAAEFSGVTPQEYYENKMRELKKQKMN